MGGTLSYALVQNGPAPSEIDPDEYLLAELSIPWTDHGSATYGLDSLYLRDFGAPPVPEFRQRIAAVVTGLRDRLSTESGVDGLATGSRLPEMEHLRGHIEVEGEDQSEVFQGHRVRLATVDIGFFDGLGHGVLNSISSRGSVASRARWIPTR